MKVSINREALRGFLKSMIRVVPKSSPVMELMGFLVECNEDDGYMYITATNLETSIQRKIKADIEEGGSLVVSAKLFYDIVERLGGDRVTLEYDDKYFDISSGSCRYEIPVLAARNYPKPNIPFPDDIMKIKGICTMYNKVAASVSTDKDKPALTGIHIDVYSDAVRAASCDVHRMSVTSVPCETGGKLSVTIPKQSLFYLANAVDDSDTVEFGLCGNTLVFMSEDMMFSSRIIHDRFIDVDRLTDGNGKKHIAKIKAADLQSMIGTVSTIANLSEDVAPVSIKFGSNSIGIKVESELASTQTDIPAEISEAVNTEYYYNARYLIDALKVIKGDASIQMTGGVMYISDALSEYMMLNTKKREVKRKAKKKAQPAKAKKAA